MSDLQKYISQRKKTDPDFDQGFTLLKFGEMLKEARINAGLTQDDLASLLATQKSAISRIENHSDDVKLSTLERFASALGKKLEIRFI